MPFQQFNKVFRHWGFTGTTRSQVANAYNGKIKPGAF